MQREVREYKMTESYQHCLLDQDEGVVDGNVRDHRGFIHITFASAILAEATSGWRPLWFPQNQKQLIQMMNPYMSQKRGRV